MVANVRNGLSTRTVHDGALVRFLRPLDFTLVVGCQRPVDGRSPRAICGAASPIPGRYRPKSTTSTERLIKPAGPPAESLRTPCGYWPGQRSQPGREQCPSHRLLTSVPVVLVLDHQRRTKHADADTLKASCDNALSAHPPVGSRRLHGGRGNCRLGSGFLTRTSPRAGFNCPSGTKHANSKAGGVTPPARRISRARGCCAVTRNRDPPNWQNPGPGSARQSVFCPSCSASNDRPVGPTAGLHPKIPSRGARYGGRPWANPRVHPGPKSSLATA